MGMRTFGAKRTLQQALNLDSEVSSRLGFQVSDRVICHV
jgi:hypothetical protein